MHWLSNDAEWIQKWTDKTDVAARVDIVGVALNVDWNLLTKLRLERVNDEMTNKVDL